jgi:hypothetical protein
MAEDHSIAWIYYLYFGQSFRVQGSRLAGRLQKCHTTERGAYGYRRLPERICIFMIYLKEVANGKGEKISS